ncbi:MAG: aspartate/tyrosine/aromatic aminotransferase [Exilibacterium sp.]
MFEKLALLPPDPILGLMTLYQGDNNPDKMDLGVGVYKDEKGQTPIFASVKEAEKCVYEAEDSKVYIGPTGTAGFNAGMQKLLLGESHGVLAAPRVATVQTPGGCGALRVSAELIRRCSPDTTVWVSDPTWANHIPLLGNTGLNIKQYPYYDYSNHTIRFDEMLAVLEKVKAGDMVLLHGCCHNPCGADLDRDQWREIAALAERTGFVPFFDIAYLGLGQGLEEDAFGVRLLAETVPEMVVASSCSKNFGLYRERVGAVTLMSAATEQLAATQSQLLEIIRGIYSMPPSHGGAIVERILGDAQLMKQWRGEVAQMRERIHGLRRMLVERFNAKGAAGRFDFIAREQGMFSFLGLNAGQVKQLQRDYSIYMVGSSRINVAGVSQTNIDYLVDAVISVL